MKKTLSLVLSLVMLLSAITGTGITALAKSIINEIDIYNVTEPEAGKTADFSAAMYDIETANIDKNSQNSTNVQNGISWYNVTDEAYINPASPEKFKCGHTYRIDIMVQTSDFDAYEFEEPDYTHATINGKNADVDYSNNVLEDEKEVHRTVSVEFDVEGEHSYGDDGICTVCGEKLDKVVFDGIDSILMNADETPSYSSVSVSRTDGMGTIKLNDTVIKFQKKNGSSWDNLLATETFAAGETYRLHLSAKVENYDTFKNSTKCYFGETELTKADGEIETDEDYYYINNTKAILHAYYNLGICTTDVSEVEFYNVPTIEPGNEIVISGYNTSEGIETTAVEMQKKNGEEWEAATKYECETEYRLKFDFKAKNGYYFETAWTAKVDGSAAEAVFKDSESGTVYYYYPAPTTTHTYGTEGDARFTCSVCGAFSQSKKDEAEKAESDAKDAAAADIAAKILEKIAVADKVTKDDKAAIEAARAVYDSLTDDQKAKVPAELVKKLEEAEKALAAAEKAEADKAATDKAADKATTAAQSDTVKLTLKKIKVKKSAKKIVLKATLKINGKAVKGKTVIFKFAGKKFKAKTNKKGIAKVTIKGKKLKAVKKKLKVGKKVKYQASYGKKVIKKTAKVAK